MTPPRNARKRQQHERRTHRRAAKTQARHAAHRPRTKPKSKRESRNHPILVGNQFAHLGPLTLLNDMFWGGGRMRQKKTA